MCVCPRIKHTDFESPQTKQQQKYSTKLYDYVPNITACEL